MKKKIVFAVPKGRILDELVPLIKKAGILIEKEFFEENSRRLSFKTNYENLEIIRVRAFDVATFVAFGAAQIGVAGDDVLTEFDYEEIYSILDLKIGKCRLSVAKVKSQKDLQKPGQILVATKYKKTVTDFFAKKGIRADCIKLNGAIELAPTLGMCTSIVDLVSSGKTLVENGLVETEVLIQITSKLIVNKVAFKLLNNEISHWIKKIEGSINE